MQPVQPESRLPFEQEPPSLEDPLERWAWASVVPVAAEAAVHVAAPPEDVAAVAAVVVAVVGDTAVAVAVAEGIAVVVAEDIAVADAEASVAFAARPVAAAAGVASRSARRRVILFESTVY